MVSDHSLRAVRFFAPTYHVRIFISSFEFVFANTCLSGEPPQAMVSDHSLWAVRFFAPAYHVRIFISSFEFVFTNIKQNLQDYFYLEGFSLSVAL